MQTFAVHIKNRVYLYFYLDIIQFKRMLGQDFLDFTEFIVFWGASKKLLIELNVFKQVCLAIIAVKPAQNRRRSLQYIEIPFCVGRFVVKVWLIRICVLFMRISLLCLGLFQLGLIIDLMLLRALTVIFLLALIINLTAIIVTICQNLLTTPQKLDHQTWISENFRHTCNYPVGWTSALFNPFHFLRFPPECPFLETINSSPCLWQIADSSFLKKIIFKK